MSTPATAKVTWKRDREAGEWEAYVDGEADRIAHCYVNDGTLAGYWGRYRGGICGRRVYVTTFREFKKMTQAAADERLEKARAAAGPEAGR